MDCTREDVFAEAVLLLAAVANLSDFEARRCLRPSGNLAGRIKNRGFLRIFSARYSACFSARLSSRRVCVSYSQSFIRAYVLDNIYICILMYALFYVALWYATNIIKRIEKSNREMSTTIANNKTVSTLCRVYYVASNQRHNLTRSFNYAIQLTLALFTENPPQKLDRLILLKNKKTQFEEVIVKTVSRFWFYISYDNFHDAIYVPFPCLQTDAQKVTTRHLEDEMCRLDTELTTTSSKIARLEKIIEKYKQPDKSSENSAGVVTAREDERPGGELEGAANPLENFKILEPSFPPSLPPEPPPRKYGIFVSRPPGQRRASLAAAPPKIGFK
ncbi:uncharacterized protein LOC116845253 isoform X4 [Odontomachus brunneus]|uniref:uncharacterized protein LOC116845253 isoform X4 n=1 Tax=Odontomachus brunneus TaxID=486640 RepID=UPI0013F1B55C|nr:uncharacterized protein LOC116845253 isoform X4 [Odontomachus brunneus]